MKLVVGLGNPGDRYADTYHNIGFIALDRLVERFSAPAFSRKDNAEVCDALVSGQRVMFIKPQTYMNLSGDAVEHFAHYFKIDPHDILVIYDDIDINKGTVRARPNGSAGTHNGMRDIIAKLGSTEFARIRIGTGLKPNYMDLADYVLSHMTAAETPTMLKAADKAGELAAMWIAGEPWQDLTVTV